MNSEGNEKAGVPRERFSPIMARVLDEARRELGWRSGAAAGSETASGLAAMVQSAAERLGFNLSSFERDEIIAHLESDWSPFGIIQPLIDDSSISDIIISSFNRVTVQTGRRNVRTSMAFPDQESYEGFVERLLHRMGTTCTTKQPIADGMVGTNVRVNVIHRSLCDEGPYVTLRVNRFSEVTLDHLVASGLAPREILNYLASLVVGGKTMLIVGEVGTGKTTLARALAGAIPAHESILVIEDTPEIRLVHPHVRYVTTRVENVEGAGKISPAQCIRAGMRMAMNRIVFGEIRDAEAAESFVDVCSSGHPGLSTLHARTAVDAVTRMELFLGRAERGVERNVILNQISTAVQAIVSVAVCPNTGRRRITDIREIGAFADGALRHRHMFQYELQDGLPSWKVVHRLSGHREVLESGPYQIALSRLPDRLELSVEVAYREVATHRRIAA